MRQEFPRLYFLSDDEVVRLMATNRSPQSLIPYAKKCFHGIDDLGLELPNDTRKGLTTLDISLNGRCRNLAHFRSWFYPDRVNNYPC